ncbi:hypothetical protein [Kribbella sp. NPDC004875]|uniref:hypothetical protein n=1 Tax=Kribbella sp. NPDC004875 TaxID=3364107 RepID=UPI0036C45635
MDLTLPGWPDGTMRGLINGVCNVLRAENDDYAVETSDSGLNWVELEQGMNRIRTRMTIGACGGERWCCHGAYRPVVSASTM